MAKLTKTSVFKAQPAKSETAMEKTTRIARQMIEADSEKRQTKNDRLRKARLEREAGGAPQVKEVARKKRTPKATAQ